MKYISRTYGTQGLCVYIYIYIYNHAPAAFYPRKRAGTLSTGGWVGPRAGLDRCGKSRPHRDSILDRPARSQSHIYIYQYISEILRLLNSFRRSCLIVRGICTTTSAVQTVAGQLSLTQSVIGIYRPALRICTRTHARTHAHNEMSAIPSCKRLSSSHNCRPPIFIFQQIVKYLNVMLVLYCVHLAQNRAQCEHSNLYIYIYIYIQCSHQALFYLNVMLVLYLIHLVQNRAQCEHCIYIYIYIKITVFTLGSILSQMNAVQN